MAEREDPTRSLRNQRASMGPKVAWVVGGPVLEGGAGLGSPSAGLGL